MFIENESISFLKKGKKQNEVNIDSHYLMYSANSYFF